MEGPETPQSTPPPAVPEPVAATDEAEAMPVDKVEPEEPAEPPETEAQKEQREKHIVAACARVRLVVKKLCDAGNAPSQNKTASDQEATQVTLLSCYYVQQYYHPKHEQLVGEREPTDVAAIGCIFVACKVADHARRIKNVVRAYNQVLQEEKKRELSDEQQTQLVEKMLKIEFLLLRAVAFHFDVLTPLQFLDQQTDRLVEGLFSYSAFADVYPYDKKVLRSNLYMRAVKFCLDGYAGNPALSKCVENLSLASLVFAARLLLRSRAVNTDMPKVCDVLDTMPELVGFMVKGELTPEQHSKVQEAVEGIMKVYRKR